MARSPNEKAEEAYKLFKQGKKLIEIASQLKLPPGTVRRWKSTYKWDNERSDKKSERSHRKKGGQPGNKNSVGNDGGAPAENKNAVKHGLFEKYLPEETLDIVNNMSLDPLDILWDQIKIAYAAIVRAQKIAYVRDDKDHTIIQSGYKEGKISGEDYAVQTAIDRQTKFMQAQARAQSELRSLIKQYEEMLHNNWNQASEEQKLRIKKLRYEVSQLSGGEDKDDSIHNFLKAVKPSQEDLSSLYEGGENDDSQEIEEKE